MGRLFITILFLVVEVGAQSAAQTTPASGKTPSPPPLKAPTIPVQSNAPSVFELLRTRYRFENDGTGQKEVIARIRIVNETGTRQRSELTFEYHPFSEELQIPYVRVRKTNGAVVNVETSLVQHPPADVNPWFDLDKKRIEIPGLAVGDRVEYDVLTTIYRPLGVGQFCVQHSFQLGAVLREQLEIEVPKKREIKVKSLPRLRAWETVEVATKVYHFEKRNSEPSLVTLAPYVPGRTPDVQISSFRSWEEVGRWYADLERAHRLPTPEVKAKADELTKGLKADRERVEVLYNFAAKRIKYVSLASLGIGGYEPHSADETLHNGYGDCKDKTALLRALLEAEGFNGSSVLISGDLKLDLAMPSPWYFDHVISVMHLGKEEIWMDASPAVLPFGMLASPLRDIPGLVIPPVGTPHFETTPAAARLRNSSSEEIEGTVDTNGALEVMVKVTLRGDAELPIRQAFFESPEKAWPNVVRIAVPGINRQTESIADVKITDPTDTTQPFTLSFVFAKPHFADITSRKITFQLPLAKFDLPPTGEEGVMDANGGWHRGESEPVQLGLPGEREYGLKLHLPPSYNADLPHSVAFKSKGAEYAATYTRDDGTLTVTRRFAITKNQVSSEFRREYSEFRSKAAFDMDRRFSSEFSERQMNTR